jgi:hypothetical protein
MVELLEKIGVAITNKEYERVNILCGWMQALMWVCRGDENEKKTEGI